SLRGSLTEQPPKRRGHPPGMQIPSSVLPGTGLWFIHWTRPVVQYNRMSQCQRRLRLSLEWPGKCGNGRSQGGQREQRSGFFFGTLAAPPPAQSHSPVLGSRGPCQALQYPPTKSVPCHGANLTPPASLSLPMPWRRPAARTSPSSTTSAAQAPT